MLQVASLLVMIAGAYGAVGLIFAIMFVARLVQRFDPASQGSPVLFRVLILPGTVALWPVLLVMIIRRSGGAPES